MGRESKGERWAGWEWRTKQRDVLSGKGEQEKDVLSGKGEQNREMC